VKKEPTSRPSTRGRSSGALVICEGAHASSPPARGRKRKPKKEDVAAAAASDLTTAEAARAEDEAVREAIARSLEDLVPTENTLPMDAVLAWSMQDWERKEAEQQRWLLDLAAVRRRRLRTTRRTRQRSVGHQAGGLQRRRLVPADAATPQRPWAGVQPLGPQPKQPAGVATAGRRRLQRRRRLHGVLPPFQHVERRISSLVYVSL
jgi:hypothetical protein